MVSQLFPKWSLLTCLGINSGSHTFYASKMKLMLNLITGLELPRYHCQYCNFFKNSYIAINLTLLAKKHGYSVWVPKYNCKYRCLHLTYRIENTTVGSPTITATIGKKELFSNDGKYYQFPCAWPIYVAMPWTTKRLSSQEMSLQLIHLFTWWRPEHTRSKKSPSMLVG